MSVKTEDEIVKFKKAVKHTTNIHRQIEQAITSGTFSTAKLDMVLESGLQAPHITGYSFKPIVSYNHTIPDLHYYHRGETIPGDAMILVDIGYKCDGYCADMTRCYNVTNPAKKNLYTFVQNIQHYVKGIVRAGMTFDELEDAYLDVYIRNLVDMGLLSHDTMSKETKESVRSILQPHTIGHSIHKVVHEPLSTPFAVNMIITIEPGIYFSNDCADQLRQLGVEYDKKMLAVYASYGGARYEDMFLIKQNGCEQI